MLDVRQGKTGKKKGTKCREQNGRMQGFIPTTLSGYAFVFLSVCFNKKAEGNSKPRETAQPTFICNLKHHHATLLFNHS